MEAGSKDVLRSAGLPGIKVPTVPMVRLVQQRGEAAAVAWFPERNRLIHSSLKKKKGNRSSPSRWVHLFTALSLEPYSAGRKWSAGESV